MTFYTYDIYGRFAGVSDVETPRSTAIEPPELSEDYNWNDVAWMHAPNVNLHFISPTKEIS